MDIQPLDILKWVGLALAAGFVGYFGRYLSMLIIDKIHKRKSEPLPAATRGSDNIKIESGGSTEKERLKLEKKKLKKESKAAKKKGTN